MRAVNTEKRATTNNSYSLSSASPSSVQTTPWHRATTWGTINPSLINFKKDFPEALERIKEKSCNLLTVSSQDTNLRFFTSFMNSTHEGPFSWLKLHRLYKQGQKKDWFKGILSVQGNGCFGDFSIHFTQTLVTIPTTQTKETGEYTIYSSFKFKEN